MTSDASSATFRCAPLGARLTQAWGALCYWGLIGGIGTAIVHAHSALAGWVVAPFAGVAVVVATARGFRLSIRASQEGVWVRNLWTTHYVAWGDVVAVKEDWRSAGIIARLPTIVFVKEHGKVTAHGVPKKEWERSELLKELKTLAPPGVQFANS